MREEMRLAYVAVTRAKSHLLCTTSWWRDGTQAVEPSEIFNLIAGAASGLGGMLVSDVAAPEDGSENPTIENPISAQWPRDPLGNRRGAFDAAIELVKSAPIHSLQQSQSAEINS